MASSASKEADFESQSFLLPYTDDRVSSELAPASQTQPVSRRKKLVSHGLVFLATSLLWLALFALSPSHPASNKLSQQHLNHGTLGSSSSGGSGGGSGGGSSRHNITTGAKLITCGSSGTTKEARERGCKYDMLLNMWVPAPCFDDEFLKEYQDDASWAAFADKNMTVRIGADEIAERDHYYTSVRDHVNHCAVMWKKQFWALFEERGAIDTMSASPGHTDHCAQYLMDVGESKYWTESTKVERGFAGCWVRE